MKGAEPRVSFQILSRDDLYRIHVATLDLLEDVGVAVFDPYCLGLLKESGATIDDRRRIAAIPEHLVRDALRSVPSRISLRARNPEYDMRVEEKRVHFGANGPNVPSIVDLESGARRRSASADVANFAKLADGLENIHTYGGVPMIGEVPPEVADVQRFAITFNNTEKVLSDSAPGKVNAQAFIRMAAAVVGSLEELKKRPMILGYGCPVAPLQYAPDSLDWLVEFAKHGLPYSVVSEPMGGASCPVTLAGGLVVMNAEVLSGVVISQLINRGTPIVYGTNPFPVDMRTGCVVVGAPEVGLTGAASTQLAQYYGIPSSAVCGPDTKILDAQFGFERAPLIPAAMTGCNMVSVAGMIEGGLTASFEEMVLDDEFFALIYRLMQGLDVTEESLALDVIKGVGPGGHFLSNPHTVKYATKEVWYPRLIDRASRSMWEKDGAKTMEQRANERAKKILKEHTPPPLDKSVQDEISQIVKEAEKLLRKS